MNSLILSVLRVLSDGQFHSGENLAQRFNVSRTTIWKTIHAGKAQDIDIFSVRGRGYKLAIPLMFLDVADILKNCAVANQVRLKIYPELESTNSTLTQLANENSPSGTCIMAEIQTAGKGRRGRKWASSLGASLTFSLLWRFDCGAAGLSGLSLVVGVALIRALNEVGVTAQLKWPNDVLINHKKLAGILIELQGDMDGPSAAVIGIGINRCLTKALQQLIDQPVTDIVQHQNNINANELMGNLLTHLFIVLTQFSVKGFSAFQAEWQHYHAYQLQNVRLLAPDGTEQTGIALGVDFDGALLFEGINGKKRVISGEVSLRALAS